MPLSRKIQEICHSLERQVLEAVKEIGNEWEPVVDEDGNDNVPSDEREVLVFLWGGQGPDVDRPEDAPYGMRTGYYDHEKHYWRVHGTISRYVTHWQDKPADPPNSFPHRVKKSKKGSKND